jgi:quinol monooxygenase YgiN
MLVVAGFIRIAPGYRQAALDEHFQQPHMADFQKILATLGVIDMRIRRYAIAQAGPLRD